MCPTMRYRGKNRALADNCDGNRDGGGDEHQGSNKGENGSGYRSGNVGENGDDSRDKGAGEIESRNLQSGNLGR